MSEERPRVGLAVHIRKDGKILLGRRVSEHAYDLWSVPGGHLEYGEDFIAGALRETTEECGLTISTPWLAAVTNDIFTNGRHYITLHMLADWVAGEPEVREPDKIIGWQWQTWEDLVPEQQMPGTQSLLKQGFHPFKAAPLGVAA